MRHTKLGLVAVCTLGIALNIAIATSVLDAREYIPSREYMYGCVIGYVACIINLRIDKYMKDKKDESEMR